MRNGGGGLAGFSTSLVIGGALAGGGGFPGFSVLTDDETVALEWELGVTLFAGLAAITTVGVMLVVFPEE